MMNLKKMRGRTLCEWCTKYGANMREFINDEFCEMTPEIYKFFKNKIVEVVLTPDDPCYDYVLRVGHYEACRVNE